MKKLLLIRHAKAVHDTGYSDFARPLKNSGTHDAMMMAQRMASESIKPQLLITSPSLRTAATADIFSEHLNLPKPKEDGRIYDAALDTLLDLIEDFPEGNDFVALVGHNPGISEILNYFTQEFREVSPGTAALLIFEVDQWKQLSKNTGQLTWFSSPKDN